MTKIVSSPIAQLLKDRHFFSLAMLRLLGYVLIAMAAIDFISLVIPPYLMNPVWEFQTFGSIVERLPIVLLGFVFIFCGEREDRTFIEQKLIKWFSWLTLILAIFLFITSPLSIINGFRIYYGENARVNYHISNKVEALETLHSELKVAESLVDLSNILQKQSSSAIELPTSIDKEQIQNDILHTIVDRQQQLKSQGNEIKRNKGFILLKQGIKWNLGALISTFLLLFIWQNTNWSRMELDLDKD